MWVYTTFTIINWQFTVFLCKFDLSQGKWDFISSTINELFNDFWKNLSIGKLDSIPKLDGHTDQCPIFCLAILVKTYPKVDFNFLMSCQIVIEFFIFSKIFCCRLPIEFFFNDSLFSFKSQQPGNSDNVRFLFSRYIPFGNWAEYVFWIFVLANLKKVAHCLVSMS